MDWGVYLFSVLLYAAAGLACGQEGQKLHHGVTEARRKERGRFKSKSKVKVKVKVKVNNIPKNLCLLVF